MNRATDRQRPRNGLVRRSPLRLILGRTDSEREGADGGDGQGIGRPATDDRIRVLGPGEKFPPEPSSAIGWVSPAARSARRPVPGRLGVIESRHGPARTSPPWTRPRSSAASHCRRADPTRRSAPTSRSPPGTEAHATAAAAARQDAELETRLATSSTAWRRPPTPGRSSPSTRSSTTRSVLRAATTTVTALTEVFAPWRPLRIFEPGADFDAIKQTSDRGHRAILAAIAGRGPAAAATAASPTSPRPSSGSGPSARCHRSRNAGNYFPLSRSCRESSGCVSSGSSGVTYLDEAGVAAVQLRDVACVPHTHVPAPDRSGRTGRRSVDLHHRTVRSGATDRTPPAARTMPSRRSPGPGWIPRWCRAGAPASVRRAGGGERIHHGEKLGPSRRPIPARRGLRRTAVRLNSPGQYVEFTLSRPANALTLRYSIPDAVGGGGLKAPLDVTSTASTSRR